MLLASARRSVFLRRRARFFTLSLPLQCPIELHQTPAAWQYQEDSPLSAGNCAGGPIRETVQSLDSRGSPALGLRVALPSKGALKASDIELLHLHHGLKGPLGFGGVGVVEHLWHALGDHLP